MFAFDRRARSSCWQPATMWERWKLYLPLACICIIASAVLLMLRQFLLDTSVSYIVVVILGIIAAVLFLFGLCLIIIFWRGRLHNPTTQVVISSIPDEDLEKSPAPILPYNHVPHRLPFVVKACSVGLPDYFTAIQNFDESTFDSTLNEDVWTEDVPETPPPCYEKALEMTALALLTVAANQVDAHSSEQYDFTQETMDTSDELFV